MKIKKMLDSHGIKEPTYGIQCDDGWSELVEDLINQIVPLGWDKDLVQIKEKFGGLRFYVGESNKEIDICIDWAEKMSFKVCEYCGSKQAKIKARGGWWKTMCDSCENEHRKL